MTQMVKNLPAMQETWVQSLSWDDPLEKEMATPVFWPGESHAQREEPGGLQPLGHTELGTTEQLRPAHDTKNRHRVDTMG